MFRYEYFVSVVESLIQDFHTCQTLLQLEFLAGCVPLKGIAAVSVGVTGAADVSLKLLSLWPLESSHLGQQ